MKRRAMWSIAVAVAGVAATGRAEAQWAGVPSTSAIAGRNTVMNPYANPYMNPYLYNNAPRGGVGAAMIFMSGQQAISQAAQTRAAASQEREAPRGAGRGRMNTPGAGAARYFGGGVGGGGPVGAADEGQGSRFLRHDRYFRPNG